MKITYYVPDSALPPAFTMARCAQFREWSRGQLRKAFPKASISVQPDTMLDAGYQGVIVENGTQSDTFLVNTFCVDLIWEFCETQFRGSGVKGRQSFAGSFFKWTDL